MKRKKITQKALSLILSLAVLVGLCSFFPLQAEAASYIAYGIDVSAWQGSSIDWSAVKASGIDFVILRAGTSKGKDKYFESNYTAAKLNGLNVGAYFYSYALSADEAATEAETVKGWLAGKRFEYPIYFDIEDSSQLALTTTERMNILTTFNTALENANYFVGVYCSTNWLTNYLDRATITAKYSLWEAKWTTSGTASSDRSSVCNMWQYYDKGSVSGISGNVDLDVSYVDYPTIIKKLGFNGFAEGSVTDTFRGYYSVTASTLNMRSGAGTSNSVVTTIPNATEVAVIGLNSDSTWANIIYQDQVGWVSIKYLTFVRYFNYTFSYETNDDTAAGIDSSTVVFGASVTVSNETPTAKNKTFKGWRLQRVSDGAWYSLSDGWISTESEASLLSPATVLTADEAFVNTSVGDDSFVLSASWTVNVKLGDVNGDGRITAQDINVLRKYISGNSSVSSISSANADMDGNGRINSQDVTRLKRYLSGN